MHAQERTWMEPSNMDVTKGPGSLQDVDCTKMTQVLARVGEKWSVLIIMTLDGGAMRFSELKRVINGISQRMLTLCLRGLERDGLVKRTVFPQVPPRVEYELTSLGRSLTGPIQALGTWVRDHLDEIEVARATYETNKEADAC